MILFLLSHHLNFPKRPYSSINTLLYKDFISFESVAVRNLPVKSMLNLYRIVYMFLFGLRRPWLNNQQLFIVIYVRMGR